MALFKRKPKSDKAPPAQSPKPAPRTDTEAKLATPSPDAPLSEARAKTRLIRTSPQKLNELVRSIRGKKVERALNDLSFSRRRVAVLAKKVLESAIANAETNHNMNIDDLIVSEAYVGKNIVMRRFRPRAKGRAAPIRKPFSELTIIVREVSALPAEAIAPVTSDTQATSGAA